MSGLAFIIGGDAGKSLSPLIWNYWFQKFGIDVIYDYFTVFEYRFEDFLSKFRSMKDLVFFNVTTPYKQRVFEHVDSSDARAQAIGATNAVVVKNGSWCAHNYDGWGFIQGLNVKKPDFDYYNSKILVLGTGGTAISVILSLLDMGAKEVYSVSRDRAQALRICERFGLAGAYSMDQLPSLLCKVDLIFNGTILSCEQLGLDDRDLVYDPNYGCCFAKGEEFRVVDGLWMLIYQASRALSQHFGVDPGCHEQLFEFLLQRLCDEAVS